MEGSDDGSISSSPEHSGIQSVCVEELKQMLVCTALELESVRVSMRSQRQMFEARVNHLEELLRQAQKERQEAIRRYEELASLNGSSFPLPGGDEDLLLFPTLNQQKLEDDSIFLVPLLQQVSQEPTWNNYEHEFFHGIEAGVGVEDRGLAGGLLLQNGSALASILAPLQQQDQQRVGENPSSTLPPALTLKLPERGRFLETVMQAGPLLNTLLLAGPLPEWHHPPPGMALRIEDRSLNISSPAISEQQQSSCVSDGDPSECPSLVYKRHATQVC